MNLPECLILFPDQLFEKKYYPSKELPIFLVKDPLYFDQFLFHKQKIIFHLESINNYQIEIPEIKIVESLEEILIHLPKLKKIHIFEIRDNWLEKKISKFSKLNEIEIKEWPSPAFLLAKKDYDEYFLTNKENFRQEYFYRFMRKKFNILLSDEGEPLGGKWNYDSLNRKKWPKGKSTPKDPENIFKQISSQTKEIINQKYAKNYGLDNLFYYETKRKKIKENFETFLAERFIEFGPYEDAIFSTATRLNHSMISMYLNVGLITPREIIEAVQNYFNNSKNSLESAEGFVRQIIGWREFVAGVYEIKGTKQRNSNFFKHKRKLPDFFWTGQSNLAPFDDSWQKLNKFAYVHHIERLMIFGNLMLLLEIDPDEVYKWFMTFFVDAYDWVMVPNVYGMSQFADGGLFATKPYISGSNYILKMSNYKKGEWSDVWDGLYWSFIKRNREYFAGNYRLAIMAKALDNMSKSRFDLINYKAEKFRETI